MILEEKERQYVCVWKKAVYAESVYENNFVIIVGRDGDLIASSG